MYENNKKQSYVSLINFLYKFKWMTVQKLELLLSDFEHEKIIVGKTDYQVN